MRSFVSALMISAIFMLSLACGVSFCPMQASATQIKKQPDTVNSSPCHQQSNSQTHDCVSMTNMDCLGTHLTLTSDNHNLVKDNSFTKIDFNWADLTIDYDNLLENPMLIRGPPFGFSQQSSFNKQPLYLATQRLRI